MNLSRRSRNKWADLCGVPEARALVRSLQRDGAPIADDGALIHVGSGRTMAVERFDRLGEPRVLLEHLSRIGADPAAAIGSANELVESVCKFVLDDYHVEYSQTASLLGLCCLTGRSSRPPTEARRGRTGLTPPA